MPARVGDKKKCSRCHETKFLEHFYKDKTAFDGYSYWCKLCSEECKATWTENNRERVRELHKRHRQTHKYKERMSAREEKTKCVDIANAAERSGRIKKKPCEVCDSLDAHKHHDDYSKPLDVRFLCRKHHVEFHKGQVKE